MAAFRIPEHSGIRGIPGSSWWQRKSCRPATRHRRGAGQEVSNLVEGGQLGVVHVQDHSWMIDQNPLLQTHTMLESRPLVQTQTILEKTPGSATWATVIFVDDD